VSIPNQDNEYQSVLHLTVYIIRRVFITV